MLAKENTHWYDRDGNPVYEVPARKGGMRPTTLADARKHDLVPGFSKIADQAPKPGLLKWKLQQILYSSLTLPRIVGETTDQYAKRIIQDSEEQGKRARETGTQCHAAIERYIRSGIYDPAWEKHIARTEEALAPYVKLRECETETTFCCSLGFGGRCDGRKGNLILDIKTKKTFPPPGQQMLYDEHAMQLAAYSKGLKILLREAKAISVFVQTDEPDVRIFEHTREALERGWTQFQCLLWYWQVTNNFGPFSGNSVTGEPSNKGLSDLSLH